MVATHSWICDGGNQRMLIRASFASAAVRQNKHVRATVVASAAVRQSKRLMATVVSTRQTKHLMATVASTRPSVSGHKPPLLVAYA